eukprot:TRINITY_DN741_c0_g1_i2.p1 TRINITY_DN741_c0_g1~~TRINITY_DN741_c0_g1_i2.p1  ORF type:complete len:158 (+),score=19.99 TRINITY_DN741_c0_g1_i2:111-584(+)
MAAHFHLLARAQDFLKSPTFRAGLTSAVVMSVGDLTCQAISNSVVDAKESRPKTKALVAETKDVSSSGSSRSGFDLQRTARFGLVGLTLHGPFFYHGMQQLDLRFGPAKSLQMAVQKSLIGQVYFLAPCECDQFQVRTCDRQNFVPQWRWPPVELVP